MKLKSAIKLMLMSILLEKTTEDGTRRVMSEYNAHRRLAHEKTCSPWKGVCCSLSNPNHVDPNHLLLQACGYTTTECQTFQVDWYNDGQPQNVCTAQSNCKTDWVSKKTPLNLNLWWSQNPTQQNFDFLKLMNIEAPCYEFSGTNDIYQGLSSCTIEEDSQSPKTLGVSFMYMNDVIVQTNPPQGSATWFGNMSCTFKVGQPGITGKMTFESSSPWTEYVLQTGPRSIFINVRDRCMEVTMQLIPSLNFVFAQSNLSPAVASTTTRNDVFSVIENDPGGTSTSCKLTNCNILDQNNKAVNFPMTVQFQDSPLFTFTVDTIAAGIWNLFLNCSNDALHTSYQKVYKIPINLEVKLCDSYIVMPTTADSSYRTNDAKILNGTQVLIATATTDAVMCPFTAQLLNSDGTAYNGKLVRLESDGTVYLNGTYGIETGLKVKITTVSGFQETQLFNVEVINCENYINLGQIQPQYLKLTADSSLLAGTALTDLIVTQDQTYCPINSLALLQNGTAFSKSCISLVSNQLVYDGMFCDEKNLSLSVTTSGNQVITSKVFTVLVEPDCNQNTFTGDLKTQNLTYIYSPGTMAQLQFNQANCSIVVCCQQLTYRAISSQNQPGNTNDTIEIQNSEKTARFPIGTLGNYTFFIYGENEFGQGTVTEQVNISVQWSCSLHEEVSLSTKTPKETVIIREKVYWNTTRTIPLLMIDTKFGELNNRVFYIKDRFVQKLEKGTCKIRNYRIYEVIDENEKRLEKSFFDQLYKINKGGIFEPKQASIEYRHHKLYFEVQIDSKWYKTTPHLIEISQTPWTYNFTALQPINETLPKEAPLIDPQQQDTSAQKSVEQSVQQKPNQGPTQTPPPKHQEKPKALVQQKIRHFTPKGELKIQFDQKMKVPSNLTLIDLTKLTIEAIPSDESKDLFNLESQEKVMKYYGLTWSIKEFHYRELDIQVNFNNSLLLSQGGGQSRDVLRVTFKDPGFWITSDGQSKIDERNLVQEITITRQIYKDKTVQQLVERKEEIKQVSNGFTVSQLVMGYFLKFSLNPLLSSIGSIQLFAFQLCIIAYWPLNLSIVQNIILQILDFEIVETSELLDPVMNFDLDFEYADQILQEEKQKDFFNLRLVEMGFETINPILNMGGLCFIMVYAAIMVVLASFVKLTSLAVFKLCPNTQFEGGRRTKKTCRQKVDDFFLSNVFNFPVNFLFQNMIFLAISYLLHTQLKQEQRELQQNNDSFTQTFTDVFGWVCLGLLALVLALILLLVILPTRFLEKGLIQRHIGSLYMNIDLRKRINIFYLLVYTIRRISLVALIMFSRTVQSIIWVVFMLFNVLLYHDFVIGLRPFVSRALWIQEFINETLIYLGAVAMCLLTDYTCVERFASLEDHLQFRDYVGWYMIGLFILMLLYNVICILVAQWGLIKGCFKKYCLCYKMKPVDLSKKEKNPPLVVGASVAKHFQEELEMEDFVVESDQHGSNNASPRAVVMATNSPEKKWKPNKDYYKSPVGEGFLSDYQKARGDQTDTQNFSPEWIKALGSKQKNATIKLGVVSMFMRKKSQPEMNIIDEQEDQETSEKKQEEAKNVQKTPSEDDSESMQSTKQEFASDSIIIALKPDFDKMIKTCRVVETLSQERMQTVRDKIVQQSAFGFQRVLKHSKLSSQERVRIFWEFNAVNHLYKSFRDHHPALQDESQEKLIIDFVEQYNQKPLDNFILETKDETELTGVILKSDLDWTYLESFVLPQYGPASVMEIKAYHFFVLDYEKQEQKNTTRLINSLSSVLSKEELTLMINIFKKTSEAQDVLREFIDIDLMMLGFLEKSQKIGHNALEGLKDKYKQIFAKVSNAAQDMMLESESPFKKGKQEDSPLILKKYIWDKIKHIQCEKFVLDVTK